MVNKSKNKPNKDLTGKRSGKLTILSLSSKRGKRGQYYYDCICDCGNKTSVVINSLVKERTKSCGCLMKEVYTKLSEKTKILNSLPQGQAAFNDLYSRYKYRAKKVKNIDFFLTKEEFRNITTSNCYYCGIQPKAAFNKATTKTRPNLYNGSYIHNSIDRIDSSKGYTLDNSVSACYMCNYAKRDLPIKEFEKWIKILVKYQNQKTKLS